MDASSLVFIGGALLVQLICAYIGGAIAGSQRRDPLVGTIVCFVFGPVGILLMLMAGSPEPRPSGPPAGMDPEEWLALQEKR